MITEINDNENIIVFTDCNSESTETKTILNKSNELIKTEKRIVIGNLLRTEVTQRVVDTDGVIVSNDNNYSCDFQFQNTQIDFNINFENKSVSITNNNGNLSVSINGIIYEVTEYGIETNQKVNIGAPIPPKKP